MRMRCAVLVTVLAAGCGGSSPTSGGGGGGNPPPPTASVNMLGDRFSPETLRVAVGSVVAWGNGGTPSPTATSDGAGGWDSNTDPPPRAPPVTRPCPPSGGPP